MTPKPARIHHAQFQIQGAVFEFELFRFNAAKFIFQVRSNQAVSDENKDGVAYQAQMNSREAPNHFLDEVVTFLANRFKVNMRLADPPEPDKPKLQLMKSIPEEMK
jgi:hypothetical protein